MTCAQVRAGEVAGEDVADRGPDDVARDVVGAAQLALVLQLELAGDRRQRGVDVGHARHGELLAGDQRPALGVRDDVLEQRDRQPLADAGPLVDLLVLARLEGDLLDDLADELGHLEVAAAAPPIQASCAVIAIASLRVPPDSACGSRSRSGP